MKRSLSRVVGMSAAAFVVGGATWFVGQVVAGLIVVQVVGAVLHHVVRGIAAVG